MDKKMMKLVKIYKGLHCDEVPNGWCHDDDPVDGVYHCANCEECSIKTIQALIAEEQMPLVEALKVISQYPCITKLLGRPIDEPCTCAACVAKKALEGR